MPAGCPHAEAGLKSEPSAHCCADLPHSHWLCILRACRTPKWTMGAPVAGTSLALAAMWFVGACTQRLGWSLCCFNRLQQQLQVCDYCGPATSLQWIIASRPTLVTL